MRLLKVDKKAIWRTGVYYPASYMAVHIRKHIKKVFRPSDWEFGFYTTEEILKCIQVCEEKKVKFHYRINDSQFNFTQTSPGIFVYEP